MQVGERVGAMLRNDGKAVIRLLGFGSYEGLFQNPSDPIHDDIFSELRQEDNQKIRMLYNLGHRIRLDNGEVIWGSECIWGPEFRIRRSLTGKTVHSVRIMRNETGAYKGFYYA